MKYEELKKEMRSNFTFWEKWENIWWDVVWTFQDIWWLISGTCPHEATIRPVNKKDKDSICILCGKSVYKKKK